MLSVHAAYGIRLHRRAITIARSSKGGGDRKEGDNEEDSDTEDAKERVGRRARHVRPPVGAENVEIERSARTRGRGERGKAR